MDHSGSIHDIPSINPSTSIDRLLIHQTADINQLTTPPPNFESEKTIIETIDLLSKSSIHVSKPFSSLQKITSVISTTNVKTEKSLSIITDTLSIQPIIESSHDFHHDTSALIP